MARSSGGNYEQVDLRVQFTWKYVGKVTLDPASLKPIFPPMDAPAVYRLRSGLRGEPDHDCWYVGRSIRDVNDRVEIHLAEWYDPTKRQLKRFRANLQHPQGWVELDRAVGVTLNGSPHLRLTPPAKRADDPAEYEVVEIVWNLMEAAGLVSNLDYLGRASKR